MSFLKISNAELEVNLKVLVAQERKLLYQIIEHLYEVDQRKIYLERAYSSLFEYLIKDLGYSASAAQRRVEAVRLFKDVPTLAKKIENGSLNLTQIGELNRAIKQKQSESRVPISPEQKRYLAAKIEGLGTSETQKVLSQELDLQLKPKEVKRVQKDESVHVQVTFTKEQFEKLNTCRDLAAHLFSSDNNHPGLAEVIELIADQFLRKKDFITAPATACVTDVNSQEKSKTLSHKLKRDILREQKHCQYRDPITNRICKSTYRLEVDHIQPRWAGGTNERKNLRILCSNHNRFLYRKQSGLL